MSLQSAKSRPWETLQVNDLGSSTSIVRIRKESRRNLQMKGDLENTSDLKPQVKSQLLLRDTFE